MGDAILSFDEAHVGFKANPSFLGPIDLRVKRGSFHAIVGPNGAGKSTLLRAMVGLLPLTSGTATLQGEPLSTIPARQRAKTIAFLPQQGALVDEHTAEDLVLMGRFPHRGLSVFETEEDHRIVEAAMMTTGTLAFAGRQMKTLSGGEAQRVQIAAALAQQPQLLVLDEPTSSLDLKHQLDVFSILRENAVDDGLAVVIATHDLNLAASFASVVTLLSDGKVVATGPTCDVLTPTVLEPVYDVPMLALDGDLPRPWLVPSPALIRKGSCDK